MDASDVRFGEHRVTGGAHHERAMGRPGWCRHDLGRSAGLLHLH